MKYKRSFLVSLMVILSQVLLLSTTSATNTMVTDVRVTDNDTTFRYVYLYSDGQKVLETKYYKQGTEWIRQNQTEWVYDAGLCTSQIERIFRNNSWQRTFQIDYNLLNGNLVTETQQSIVNNTVNPLLKTVFEYSGSKLQGRKEYSYKNNNWSPAFFQSFHYNLSLIDTVFSTVYAADTISSQSKYQNSYYSNGYIKEQLQLAKKAEAWTNQKLINWFYRDTTSDILSVRIRQWDSTAVKWVNLQKTDYEYNSSAKLQSETNQYWNEMYWVSDQKYLYSYDENGQLLKKTMQVPLYHKWRSLTSINYSDFTQSNPSLMESRYEFWGGTKDEPVSTYIPFVLNDETVIRKAKTIELVYADADTTQSVHDINDDTHLISVYPNPSDGIFYFDVQNNGVSSWAIADLSGRILKQSAAIVSTGVIDISEFPSGVYMLRAKTSQKVLTQKLVKQ